MSGKTVKFDNIEVTKKNPVSKQAIDLNLVDMSKIIIFDKFKHSEKGFKYFIDYIVDDIVRPLCII